MSVLDATILTPFQNHDEEQDTPDTIDLRGDIVRIDRRPERDADETPRRAGAPKLPEGVRVRRIRLGSAATVAAVFSTVGYLVVLGTLVTCWNVIQRLGFVSDLEDLAITSLGLESFAIDGQRLFELSAIVFGALFAMTFVVGLLLSLVFNAACALFGGVAVELGPLNRARRVFSPRHRRFISV